MIGFLRGLLVKKQPPIILLDVQGVGYELEAPMSTFYDLPEVGKSVKLITHLTVREDAHILYGFANESARLLFRNLIKVNGVGPKLALTILSGMNSQEFAVAVQNNDVPALVCLPGIGKKTAERLVIEMRDKVAVDATADGVATASSPDSSVVQDAISALVALGYKAADASKMVRAVKTENLTSEELIRNALRGISP